MYLSNVNLMPEPWKNSSTVQHSPALRLAARLESRADGKFATFLGALQDVKLAHHGGTDDAQPGFAALRHNGLPQTIRKEQGNRGPRRICRGTYDYAVNVTQPVLRRLQLPSDLSMPGARLQIRIWPHCHSPAASSKHHEFRS